MESLILVLHIVVCVLLVILVLLQSGKEGMGVIFGGGNTSVFGSTGAGGLLAKLTAFVAVIFVGTSLAYTYTTSEHVSDDSAVLSVRIEEPAPAMPATPAPAGNELIPTAPVPQTAAPAAPAEPAAPATPAAPEAAAPASAAEAAAPAAPAEAAPADKAPADKASAKDAPAANPAQ